MALRFESVDGQALNLAHGVRISVPRIGPGAGLGEIEYYYAIYVRGVRDGFSLSGTDVGTDANGLQIRAMRIDSALLVASMLRIRAQIGTPEDPFEFLCDLAYGLICGNLTDPDVSDPKRFAVVASQVALAEAGIALSPNARFEPGNIVLLAEVVAGARRVVRD